MINRADIPPPLGQETDREQLEVKQVDTFDLSKLKVGERLRIDTQTHQIVIDPNDTGLKGVYKLQYQAKFGNQETGEPRYISLKEIAAFNQVNRSQESGKVKRSYELVVNFEKKGGKIEFGRVLVVQHGKKRKRSS